MKPIKLTTHNGNPMYDNKPVIIGSFLSIMDNSPNGSSINTTDEGFVAVKETIEQIWEMIQQQQEQETTRGSLPMYWGLDK